MKNGTIGTVEKRELASILSSDFVRTRKELEAHMSNTEIGILEQAKKKFGISVIEKQIKDLEGKIDFLKKKIAQLGFKYNYNGVEGFTKHSEYVEGRYIDVVPKTTPAGKFFALKITERYDTRALFNQENDLRKRLWLSTSKEEIQKILSEKPNIKALVVRS